MYDATCGIAIWIACDFFMGNMPAGWRSSPVYRGRGPRSGDGVQTCFFLKNTNLTNFTNVPCGAFFCSSLSNFTNSPAECLPIIGIVNSLKGIKYIAQWQATLGVAPWGRESSEEKVVRSPCGVGSAPKGQRVHSPTASDLGSGALGTR